MRQCLCESVLLKTLQANVEKVVDSGQDGGGFGLVDWGRAAMVFTFISYSNENNLPHGRGMEGKCVCDVILVCVRTNCDPKNAWTLVLLTLFLGDLARWLVCTRPLVARGGVVEPVEGLLLRGAFGPSCEGVLLRLVVSRVGEGVGSAGGTLTDPARCSRGEDMQCTGCEVKPGLR